MRTHTHLWHDLARTHLCVHFLLLSMWWMTIRMPPLQFNYIHPYPLCPLLFLCEVEAQIIFKKKSNQIKDTLATPSHCKWNKSNLICAKDLLLNIGNRRLLISSEGFSWILHGPEDWFRFTLEDSIFPIKRTELFLLLLVCLLWLMLSAFTLGKFLCGCVAVFCGD